MLQVTLFQAKTLQIAHKIKHMEHSSSVKYSGQNLNFLAETDQFKYPVASGEAAQGPSPKKLMLTALSGCTAIDVVSTLNKMRVLFSDFTVIANATLTDDHPRIYNNVELIYRIRLNDSHRQNMERAVQLSLDKYCGVSAMFSSFCKVNLRIEYL